ncbi:Cyclic nucleotide-binding domain [Popillia japonica]|uniref:Cyclic nucleotide-binding domain n=1 Tax=Popillia japonica TaxID=7064 RepID=A0AAW1KMY9_POPJA
MAVINVLDITAFIDLYMRLHFTYFNEDGVEVSHPYHTAQQHFTHSFFVDMFACFPFLRLVQLLYNPPNAIIFYLNRIIQLYRFDYFYRGIYKNHLHNQGIIVMFRYLPYIIISLNILTALSFIALCTITNDVFTCKKNTWVQEMITRLKLNKYEAYCLIFLFTIGTGTTNSFGIMKVKTLGEMVWISCAMIINNSLQFFFISNTIAASLTINRDLHAYQEAMYDLVHFFGHQKIDKHIKKEIIKHFEYMWYKTRGKSIHTCFSPFKSSFKTEALYNFYGKVFMRSSIFPAPNSSFFRSLLMDIKHEIYLITGIIYSVNDVHGDIFLLIKGAVEVVGADENKLLTLRIGSIFGNLDNCPLGRRTLSMVAAGHVEVLKFSSIVFHNHLKRFPSLRRHFMKLTIFNVDFIEEKRLLSKNNKQALFELGEVAHTASRSRSGPKAKDLEHHRIYKIYSRNKIIKFWENVVLNILYCIDYFLVLYGISTQPQTLTFTILVYILDVLYLLKMYVKFSTSFEDEFGRIVESPKEIAINYFKQKLGFYFDLATVFPFEVISLFLWYRKSHRLVWLICRCNRLLRIIPLLAYLRNITQKLNINVLIMKSIYLFTKIILLQITLGAIVEIMHEDELNSNMKTRLNSFGLSMMSIINSGWKFDYDLPRLKRNVVVVGVSASIALVCKFITWYFIADSCGILYVVNYKRKNYEHFLFFIKRYMNNENVSIPLKDRICLYIQLLWTTSRGVLFPDLLHEAPYYLKEAVLNSMFGFHLSQHPLLQHCHKDLARQMASHMKTLIFFPEDIVVYSGDIDNCMYFIHKGEVHVLSEDTLYSEQIENVLHADDMFGLEQGLYPGYGHDFTYKVVEYSIIISLRRDDWIYLLDFFPASKNVIYDRTVTL